MELEKLIEEVRRDYQIPPFFEDEGLIAYAEEGMSLLEGLNPLANINEDKTYQSLLKNYINYAYYHKVDDFMRNYEYAILSWQAGTEAPE